MAVDLLRLVDRAEATFLGRYESAVHEMLIARATFDRDGYTEAVQDLQTTIAESMAIGSLIGAADQMRSAAAVVARDGPDMLRCTAGELMHFAVQPLALAVLEFDEAVRDVAERLPITLQQAWERTAQNISSLYSEGRVIAFVRAAEQSVTDRAQKLIEQAIREGWGERRVGIELAKAVDEVREVSKPWSEAYSRMAFRTNLNTATTAGRFKQAQEPLMQIALPAMRFDAVGDSHTRPNHLAANGLIFGVRSPVWAKLAPPLSWNCRCTIVQMSRPVLRRMGRLTPAGDVIESQLPPGAGPDPGFRPAGRSDLFLGVG